MRFVPPYNDWNFHAWPAGRELGWHGHACLQAIHVLGGELDIDSGAGWRVHRPGEVHVLPPGARHRLRTRQGHRQFGLNFSESGDERGLLAELRAAFPAPATINLSSDPISLEALRDVAAGMRPEGRLRVAATLDRYCLALLAAARPASGTVAQRLGELLAARQGRPLTVALLARQLQVARATLQRASHAAFGCGVSTLQRRLRLAAAAERLVAEDASVAEIASGSGYADIFQFSRAFRRVHGMPPSRYRRSLRDRAG